MLEREGKAKARALFSKALKEGPLKAEDDYETVYSRDFMLAMTETALRGVLQKTVELISSIPEFKNAKKLLDMGGGHGLYAIAFAQTNPQLEAHLLDLPQVLESTAKECITTYSMEDRVHLIPANFFTDPLGSGYDVVFASDVLYRATAKQRSKVLQKVAASLNKGGIFATKHWFLNADRCSPFNVAEFDLRLSATQYGDSPFNIFTLGEFINLLQNSGFKLREIIDLSGQRGMAKIVVAERQ
jgi:predicted O-methyltransferase YrrM